MYTGGIETLILRMTNWLVNTGNKVDLLLQTQEGELLQNLNPNINLIILGKNPDVKFLYKYYNNEIRKDYNVIYSYSPSKTWMAMLIGEKCFVYPLILNGVYHMYDYTYFANFYHRYIFNKVLPDSNKVFMTPKVQTEHEKIFNRKIHNPFIWPLPIDSTNFINIKRNPKKYKFVSIGRLENFKTYNYTLLDIIKNLINLGYDASYFIYGTGINYDLIKDRIFELKLENNIFLKGTIPYNQFSVVLKDAFAFIGMGTSVIEAGLCKVPSITAIAYSKDPITHGLIHELKDYNCGELEEKWALYNIEDILIKLIEMSDSEYELLCDESSRILKSQYDLDILMNVFVNEICTLDYKKSPIQVPLPVLYVLFLQVKTMLSKLYQFLKKMFYFN